MTPSPTDFSKRLAAALLEHKTAEYSFLLAHKACELEPDNLFLLRRLSIALSRVKAATRAWEELEKVVETSAKLGAELIGKSGDRADNGDKQP
jgi:hypothetical protein